MSESARSGDPLGTPTYTPGDPEAEIRAREPGFRTDEPYSIGHLLSRLVDDVAILLRKEPTPALA